MKKSLEIFITVIISLILTFLITGVLGLYTFGRTPTILTTIYLFSIFSIIEYFEVIICYLVRLKKKKEVISIQKIISLILFFISLILILLFMFVTNIDWLNYYSNGNSAPFYLIIIKNMFIYLTPSIIFLIIGSNLCKNKK